MVKKLFKHEIASYLRLLIPVYLVLLGIAAMGRLIQCFEAETMVYDLLRGSSLFAFAISASVAMLLTTIFCILRFYRNLFSGEGYLTFTLPVTTTQHLLTKLGTAVLVEAATFVAILLSTCLLFAGDWLTEIIKAAAYLLNFVLKTFDTVHFTFYCIEFVVIMLATIACELCMYYMCISLGQTFRKNRVLAAVGIYFGLYMITQAFATVGSILVTIFARYFNFDEFFRWIENHPYASFHIMFGIILFLTIAMGAVYYLISHLVIRKKLNLE